MKDTEKYRQNRYIKRWSLVKRAIDLLGGKCKKCGETHVAALSFHHKNSEEKEHLVSRMFHYTTNWCDIEKEVLKCELLCENCHRKLHFNLERFEECYEQIEKMARGEKFKKEITITKWTEKENKQLKKLYIAGKSIAEITFAMTRNEATIRRKIKELSLPSREKPKRKSPIKLTDKLKKLVWELNDKFVSSFEISKQTGISVRVVYRIIEERKNG